MSRIHRIREYQESSATRTAPETVPSREFLVRQGKKDGSSVDISEIASLATRQWRLLQAPLTVAKDLFLPIGYPSTVKSGYLEYQLYDSLQGLCSYLRGVLCSAQVLQAAGVGNEHATAWAAALTWALKDGTGMMGGLVFSYVASPLFDGYVKEWRLFADLINDVGLTLDMLAPYCPSLLLISSASTLCKTMCGMSAGATKASITHYFATTGNMADLNAKESTQETLVSLIGMMLGVALASRLQKLQDFSSSGHYYYDSLTIIQWTVFVFLTAVHVWANWMGVCLLRLPTLNRERAELVFKALLDDDSVSASDASSSPVGVVAVKPLDGISFPTPDDIHESLITSTRKMLWPGQLRLGTRLVDMVRMAQDTDWMHDFAGERYLLQVHRGTVHVCLRCGARPVDELKAFCHALLVLRAASIGKQHNHDRETVRQVATLLKPLFLVDDASSSNDDHHHQQQHRQPQNVRSLLKAKGWDVDGRLYLGFPRRRTEWMVLDDESGNRVDVDNKNKKQN